VTLGIGRFAKHGSALSEFAVGALSCAHALRARSGREMLAAEALATSRQR